MTNTFDEDGVQPGPTQWMMRMCKQMQMEADIGDGEVVLKRGGRTPIPLIGWNKKEWSRAVRNQIQDATVWNLFERVNNKRGT